MFNLKLLLYKVTYSSLFSLYSCLCNPIVLTLVAATIDTIITFPDISIMDMIIRSGQVNILLTFAWITTIKQKGKRYMKEIPSHQYFLTFFFCNFDEAW